MIAPYKSSENFSQSEIKVYNIIILSTHNPNKIKYTIIFLNFVDLTPKKIPRGGRKNQNLKTSLGEYWLLGAGR